jgi:ubiquitin-conjugating enzyme E2 D/E
MNSQISQMQMGQMNPMQMPMNMTMTMHIPNNQMPNQMFMQTQPSMNTGNETMNRISQEYNFCVNDNDLVAIGCNFGLENNNIFTWRITMSGPTNTPYGGGLFTILATFPNDYPVHGPEFKFKNKIFHLNVNFSDDPGHICISSLNDWRIRGKVKDLPFYTVKQALFDIFCLFYNQGVVGAYDQKMAELYMNNRQAFDAEARNWTQLYANPNNMQ